MHIMPVNTGISQISVIYEIPAYAGMTLEQIQIRIIFRFTYNSLEISWELMLQNFCFI